MDYCSPCLPGSNLFPPGAFAGQTAERSGSRLYFLLYLYRTQNAEKRQEKIMVKFI